MVSRGGAPSQRRISMAVRARPIESLAEAGLHFGIGSKGGGLFHMNVRHDDECPTLKTQSMRDCTCEICGFDPPTEIKP